MSVLNLKERTEVTTPPTSEYHLQLLSNENSGYVPLPRLLYQKHFGENAAYVAVSYSEDDQFCLVDRKPLGFGQPSVEKPQQPSS